MDKKLHKNVKHTKARSKNQIGLGVTIRNSRYTAISENNGTRQDIAI